MHQIQRRKHQRNDAILYTILHTEKNYESLGKNGKQLTIDDKINYDNTAQN